MRAETSGIGELLANVEMQRNPKGAPFGLYVIPNWITEEEEKSIVEFLSVGEWSDEISTNRPTKHFGYIYSLYGGYSTTKEAGDWGILRKFADKIEEQFPGIKIAQCLANLYYKKSTIGAHRDKETPIVFGLSVVGDINMVWTDMNNPKIKYEASIPARSLYIMADDAAFHWKHEVPSRTTVKYPDNDGNLTIVKTKSDNYIRVSVTFRHFIEKNL